MSEGYVTLMKPVGDHRSRSRRQTRRMDRSPGEDRRRTFALKFVDSVRTSLSPNRLFDLMADPHGCLTWHAHPNGTVVSSVDAPQGLALAGRKFAVRARTGSFRRTTGRVATGAKRSVGLKSPSESTFNLPRRRPAFTPAGNLM